MQEKLLESDLTGLRRANEHTAPEPHRTLGRILQLFYWKWEEADKEFRIAATLGAHTADTQATPVAVLIRSGRFEEAAARSRKSDPVSFKAFIDTAAALRAKGQYDRAIEGFRRGIEIDPAHARGHFQLGVIMCDAVSAVQDHRIRSSISSTHDHDRRSPVASIPARLVVVVSE